MLIITPPVKANCRRVPYITFGASSLGRLLAVSHTYRASAIRIISARRVTRSERKIYEES
ncbi:hypothetical protein B9Z47_07720 [Limnohabitans sp. 2KL-1]|nr:hypothetical protein B9Z47_07720 [Limnohabitans sp. 2KL-1]